MSDVNRREFLRLAGAAGVAPPLAVSADAAVAKKYWVDPKLAGLRRKPWRKIHLDFHNSHHITTIGEEFDADEFGDTLQKANVNAIVVFAKDMHGYFYYPSKFGPVHPGLSFDLLGAQVEACRKRSIAVSAYYCVTWDHHLAENHPEWLRFRRDRTTDLPKFDETPGWTALCLAHEPFVQLVLDHAREFVARYELNGAWFDMPWPKEGECFCRECLRQLRKKGLDPLDTRVQRQHKHELYKSFLALARETVKSARPGCEVEFNEQGGCRMGERAASSDNVDIEALPTASWGYYYFPTNVRYIRTFGLTVYGMTGRFKASWADFGGLKLPTQLHVELAGIVGLGARCDIGDQMPPNGRLDKAVYHVIGETYGRIRELEPYLDGAVPATEAALVTAGLPFDKPSTEANYGLVKLLVESRIQFDVVEPDAEWERYALIVLPDDMRVSETLAERLHRFVDGGGAVIANHRSGLLAGDERSWLERYGFQYAGMSEFRPAYLVPKVNFTGSMPAYEFALYEGASQWRASAPARVLAALGEPAFQRSPEHYTSHRQTPFDHETEYAVLGRSGTVGLVGFPLGQSYYYEGYWIYRSGFQHLLRSIYPVQLVETSAPLSTEVMLTHQAKTNGRKERYMVHIVNFSALRRTPNHPDFYEDPIPLTDVMVRLHLPLDSVRVRAVVAGTELRLRRTGNGGVEVMVSRVPIHEIVNFELE